MKTIPYLLLMLLTISCTFSKKEQADVPYNAKNSLIIDYSCVIFLQPDSAEIAQMHTQYSREEYEAYVSNMTWHPGIAAAVLDSFGINHIACHDKKYIILQNAKHEVIQLVRKNINQDMILFNVQKTPFFISSVNFDEDREFVLRYFDKK